MTQHIDSDFTSSLFEQSSENSQLLVDVQAAKQESEVFLAELHSIGRSVPQEQLNNIHTVVDNCAQLPRASLYPKVQKLIVTLPIDRQKKILDRLDEYSGGIRSYVRLEMLKQVDEHFLRGSQWSSFTSRREIVFKLENWFFLDSFLRHSSMRGIDKDHEEYAQFKMASPEQITDILQFKAVCKELCELFITCSAEAQFKFQLSELLSMVQFDELSVEAQQMLNAEKVNFEASIIPLVEAWWLCGEAEEIMLDAITNDKWTSLPHFFVKGVGRLIGLPTRNLVTKNGTVLLEGMFYALVSNESRSHFRHTLAARETRSVSPKNMTLFPLRPLEDVRFNGSYHTMEEVLQIVDQTVIAQYRFTPDVISQWSVEQQLGQEEDMRYGYDENNTNY